MNHQKNDKAWVLMNKRTGDLMVGYKVTLLDSINDDYYVVEGRPYNFALVTHDGWVIQCPQFGLFAIFFDTICEEWFENLGEL